jgi:HTH-type transcriptional regulator/antitoxin HigA
MATELRPSWRPDWAIPPGEILLETLEERAMSQAELARRMNRPLKTINEIVRGRAAITPETALQLEVVFGIPASFWNNLESNYRDHLARAEANEQLERETDWVRRFPTQDMARLGLLSKTSSGVARLSELLRFFGVSSPAAWDRHWSNTAASFRQSPAFAASPEAVAVWLRVGEIAAAKLDCAPFDPEKLEQALPKIRRMTTKDPLAFWPELVDILRGCGVALVLTRELKGTHLSGATRWLSPTKALVQLSMRHRSDDQFWFALFHELAHVLRSSKRQAYVDSSESPRFDQEEADADQFAATQLIPGQQYQRILNVSQFSPDYIRRSAEEIGISPGILLGRLQRDGRIQPSQMNYLKRQFHWPDEAYQ